MVQGQEYFTRPQEVVEIQKAIGRCTKERWSGRFPAHTKVRFAQWRVDDIHRASSCPQIEEYESAAQAKKELKELVADSFPGSVMFRVGRFVTYEFFVGKKAQGAYRRAADVLGVPLYQGKFVYEPEPDSKPRFAAMGDVEYRWLGTNEFDCQFSGSSCWGMAVRAAESCENGLFVEVNFLDSNNAIVDSGIDQVASLGRGKTAKLVFHSYDDQADDVEIADISCF